MANSHQNPTIHSIHSICPCLCVFVRVCECLWVFVRVCLTPRGLNRSEPVVGVEENTVCTAGESGVRRTRRCGDDSADSIPVAESIRRFRSSLRCSAAFKLLWTSSLLLNSWALLYALARSIVASNSLRVHEPMMKSTQQRGQGMKSNGVETEGKRRKTNPLLANWYILPCRLNMTKPTSQLHRMDNSMAFFINPFFLLKNVTYFEDNSSHSTKRTGRKWRGKEEEKYHFCAEVPVILKRMFWLMKLIM